MARDVGGLAPPVHHPYNLENQPRKPPCLSPKLPQFSRAGSARTKTRLATLSMATTRYISSVPSYSTVTDRTAILQPKTFEDTDVDIAITHCGICASDLHTLRSGWGPTNYPQVVGHELAGVAVRVGPAVKHIKVGDRVGVGAQSDSCRKCVECKAGNENYCYEGQIGTYAGVHKDGHKSWGGYANFSRVPGHFVVKIPDGLPLAIAAPMLCGGVTVYNPLKKYGAGTERKDVGIIGIGGLGHFVWAFSYLLWCISALKQVIGSSLRQGFGCKRNCYFA
jgi:hypothetical protein